MTEQIKLINIAFELCGIFLCIAEIVAVCIGAKIGKSTSRYFIAIFLSLMFYLASNISGLMFRGIEGIYGFYAVRISNFCEFFFAEILSLCATLYFTFTVDKNRKMKKLYIFICFYYALQLVMLIISQFTNMYYYFDENNTYQRGEFFWVSQAFVIGAMAINAVILIVKRNSLSKKEKTSFGIYLIMPSVSIFIQLFSYGLNVVMFSLITAAFILFFYILNDRNEKYCEKERENTDMKVSIMLSQIQPHFLYNTLTSIYCLCDKDPQAAKQAISQFSKYLRGNLDSIRRKTPVSFDDELNHVQNYLALEKMRFEDELEIVYDIQANNFLIPALTVQPLVENAVKHGLGDSENGGTVKISSKELDNCFEIEIKDNGVGFDTENIIKNGESHIGIENVRNRLEISCGGTLTINSVIGKGTTAIIIIPKEA
ncbi:MAG: histidine kinase [Clostridia bacterium]|nr:histidine kinase [Clostridia bacterium]